MKDVVLDIETFGSMTHEMHELLVDGIKPDGRLKKPDKIKQYIEAKEDELLARAALSPLTGKIVCVGMKCEDDDPHVIAGPEERRILEQTIGYLVLSRADPGQMSPVRLVTFNGRKFDIPFLAARTALHGLEYPWPIGRVPGHMDLRDVLLEGSLEKWSVLFGLGKKQSQGEEIARMVMENRWDEIKQHCTDDVLITHALATRMRGCAVWR